MTTDASANLETGATARALCDVHAILAAGSVPPGIVWKMAEAGRQLDANLVSLPAGRVIDTHTECDLDVLVIVIAGTGMLTTDNGLVPLTVGELVWLPRGCTRSLAAGTHGLSYLTVHQRRAGMRIRVGQ
ncbi:cupin domain-containing protein [Pseudonocardia sp. Cha107L01]|uniref:cupin domain-containing protein n=1 Tax=Pseudonocardia sp. Cha107L01 TaxID=3457576 RepID=UPI00403E551A